MSVIPITLFFSLMLAGLFIALFALTQRRKRFTSPESDSLLPLAEEQPREVVAKHHEHDAHEHHPHDHEGACGCRTGKRAPCPGCLKRPDKTSALSS